MKAICEPLYKCSVCGMTFSSQLLCRDHCDRHKDQELVYSIILRVRIGRSEWINGPWDLRTTDKLESTPTVHTVESLDDMQFYAEISSKVTRRQAIEACKKAAKAWLRSKIKQVDELQLPPEKGEAQL